MDLIFWERKERSVGIRMKGWHFMKLVHVDPKTYCDSSELSHGMDYRITGAVLKYKQLQKQNQERREISYFLKLTQS